MYIKQGSTMGPKEPHICIDITSDDDNTIPPEDGEPSTTIKDKKAEEEEPDDTVKYMDEDKRLTDAAIDRFSIASCTRAMMNKLEQHRGRDARYPARPIGWIRSLTVTHILEAYARKEVNTMERVNAAIRKLGLGYDSKEHLRSQKIPGKPLVSLLECYDTVIISLYGGEHWSLMACYVQSEGLNHVYHYDSMNGVHAELARNVLTLLIYLCLVPETCTLRRVANYPQQRSTFECGYSVLMMVGAITVAYQVSSHDKGTPRVPLDDFPSLDRLGVERLHKVIYQSLGNSTKSAYPSEHDIKGRALRRPCNDGGKKRGRSGGESLVSYYHRVRKQMLQMTKTHCPIHTPRKFTHFEERKMSTKKHKRKRSGTLCSSAPVYRHTRKKGAVLH